LERYQASSLKGRLRFFVRGVLQRSEAICDASELEQFEFDFDSLMSAIVNHDFCPKSRHNNVFVNVIVPASWPDLKQSVTDVVRKYTTRFVLRNLF
jgi:hypothetical protein